MAFGELEATGFVLLVTLLALGAALAYILVRHARSSREAADRRAASEDLSERARIGAMRHRDFDKWFDADAARRKRVGLPALDRGEARERRFDPTYELDVPAPRRRDLARRRAQVKEAIERGEEPAAPETPAP